MGIRALIVDDDEAIREIEGERVSSLGHEWDGAGSAKEVYDLVKQNRYDYILLDMQMPLCPDGTPMDNAGEICLRELRKKYPREELPVIMITGVDVHTRNAGKAAELLFTLANDFLVKPALEGEHTLEESVRVCLAQCGKNTAMPVVAEEAWLRREVLDGRTTWKTISPTGHMRKLTLSDSLKLNLLLDCIFSRYRVDEIIKHEDICNECGWDDHRYFKRGAKTPGLHLLKNCFSRLEEELGITHEIKPLGFRFMRPEK